MQWVSSAPVTFLTVSSQTHLCCYPRMGSGVAEWEQPRMEGARGDPSAQPLVTEGARRDREWDPACLCPALCLHVPRVVSHCCVALAGTVSLYAFLGQAWSCVTVSWVVLLFVSWKWKWLQYTGITDTLSSKGESKSEQPGHFCDVSLTAELSLHCLQKHVSHFNRWCFN